MCVFLALCSYKVELSEVVKDVCGWWGGCDAVKLWLDEAEKTLSGHIPLASSVDIVEQQKRNIEVREGERFSFIPVMLLLFGV